MGYKGGGSLALCLGPSDIKEKLKITTIENKTSQCYRISKHSGGQVFSSRNTISQEAVGICQLDTRNFIPANIRHKHGSSLVEQLISPEQVQSSLKDVEKKTRNMSRITLIHDSLKPWLMNEYQHRMYYELSHCLRSNVFPGMPIKQHTLVHDSYTAEVNERWRLDNGNSQHWYGRKSDDLVLWSQKLMERNTIAKILESQQKPSRIFPLRIHPMVAMDDPTPPLSTIKKPKKHKLDKAKKTTVQSPDQDDDFWDFYEKPIP
ncbi:ciliary microtubule inner protein 4 [Mantella aurantiaca]